ncbi:MAG: acyl carrier protein [Solirubrobacterales bacterium]|nr:acyl carrier protein [Solirubrobacterales bacterium]HMT05100.1 acyl carrier protein [Solirubrobacterales bacterium]
MNRDDVMELVRTHLAAELEISPDRIQEETRFKDDLDADSLDLQVLVMELQDEYGIVISEQEGTTIKNVKDAVDFVLAKTGA